MMKVLLFGELADVIGKAAIEIKTLVNTNELRQYLINEYPSLDKCHFQIAVNREQITSVKSLNNDDEIALLPPFAGG